MSFAKLCASLIIALFLVVPTRAAAVTPSCDIAESALLDAQRIRGLSIKHHVPCFLRSKSEVQSHLVELVKKEIPAERLKFEELTLKAIGFIPEDFQYAQGIVDLYVSQLGGYYDPESKYYVMANWIPGILQKPIAVHELTHALQDQYFDLKRITDPMSVPTDQALARSALIEGDATAVMLDYSREIAGAAPLSSEPTVNSAMMQNVLGGALTSASSGVPQSLQLSLLFPYTSGLRFAHSLLKQGGYKAVSEAFVRLPVSTEEILHPEIYQSGKKSFKEFSDDAVAPEKLLHSDVVGEFMISAVLSELTGERLEAAQAAAGWGGDKIYITAAANGGYKLVWKTAWDSKADADQFYELAERGLKKKYSSRPTDTFSINRTDLEVILTANQNTGKY